MWHIIGAGAPRGAVGPSSSQVWPAVARCGWLSLGFGRLWPAAAGSGLAAAGSGQLRPAVVRPSLVVVQSDLHLCFGAAL
jgi:hypothetical protein